MQFSRTSVGFPIPAECAGPLICAIHYCWIQQPEWVAAVRVRPSSTTRAMPSRGSFPVRAAAERLPPVCKTECWTSTIQPVGSRALTQRLGAEVREFRWWLAALVKRPAALNLTDPMHPAVLLILFCRADSTRHLVNRLREVNQSVSMWLPMTPPSVPGEAESCELCRAVIAEIDCPVKLCAASPPEPRLSL